MKNNNEEEPKTYFERNVPIIIIIAAFAFACDYYSFKVLSEPNPWGIFIGIPGIVLSLQTLWLIVNPYAVVYENRFEIKQSFFYNKEFYYLDVKLVEFVNNKIIITYNDLDKESLAIFGLRESHKKTFYESIKQQVELSNKGRDF